MLVKLALFVFALVAVCSGKAPLFRHYSSEKSIPDQYIVVFKKNATLEQINEHFVNLKAHSPEELEMLHSYEYALKGYSARMSKSVVEKQRDSPIVDFIEEDQIMTAYGCQVQTRPPWGLDRITDDDAKTNGRYPWDDSNAGSKVDAYIIDTGIYVENQDFGGRAVFGFKASSSWSNTDANGHGTHVASTVGGNIYGIAKKTTLIAVKVLGDNGSGSNSGVIAGVDWTLSQSKKRSNRCVANMSLGGGYSSALNKAVDAAVDGGCVFAVAAGNDNKDCQNYSPASAGKAITVGATEIGVVSGNVQKDTRSYFSNYGTCVDVFAPGSDIEGAWIGRTSATRTISGTSMASPHVAGVAVVFADKGLSTSEIKKKIVEVSEKGEIDLKCSNSACRASPNNYLYLPHSCPKLA